MPAEIIDVHSRSNEGMSLNDLPQQIMDGLSRPSGLKTVPTMLLYDERGLRLYDDITTEAPEYYLFGAEEEILKNNTDDIVHAMHGGVTGDLSDEVVIELGAGALRKTSHILLGLSRFANTVGSTTPITYYALDLEKRELQRTLGQIESSEIGRSLQGKVNTKGMCGTYNDGLKFLEEGGLQNQKASQQITNTPMDRYTFDTSPISSASSLSDVTDPESSPPSTPGGSQPPLHIMFLGSSLGNFTRSGAIDFLRSLPLRAGSGDTLLLGLDHDNDKTNIEEAYNDRKGYTKRFIMNGLKAAGRALGDEKMFDEDKWEYINHYNTAERRHEAYYKSKCAQTVNDPSSKKYFTFLEDELVKIEESYKFSEVDAFTLFAETGLRPVQRWTDSASQYSLWLLERPSFSFPLLSPSPLSEPRDVVASTPSAFGVPSRQEWENIWAVWDVITTRMIPPSMLFQRPIDLRHICLFYLGHIPTFLDIHLSRLLQAPHTNPEEYKFIFERGIDPDVDDPSECHPHSEVPQNDEDWPKLEEILQFQSRVRARLMKLYDDIDAGTVTLTHKVGRVLFMTLEHEAMHAETLLYMLLQRAGNGTLPPPGFITPPWQSLASMWNSAPAPKTKTVTLGPASVVLGHYDDESCDTNLTTAEEVSKREFGWDNEHPKRVVQVSQFKVEWRPITNGEFYKFFKEASSGTIELPASWVIEDGIVKVRTLYGPVPIEIAENWPVMTSYNNLSTYATVQGGRLPTEPELRLFFDKFQCGYEGGGNTGFRNWHPVPATTGGEKGGQKGHNGGVWEWTSTPFERVEGFVPSTLYPGYSMDFFDGKHQVVLGGSYATIPRISDRRSFRNWYQRNYAYPWVGARVVYDV